MSKWTVGEVSTPQPQFPLFHLSSSHLVAQAVARSCIRQHLMCLTGLHCWKGSIAVPFLCYLAYRVAQTLSKTHPWLHIPVILHSIPSSFISAPWFEWAEKAPCQLCFVACLWAAAAGKARKGKENNPLTASSASFTSLHEAEQEKDLLQCTSI